MHQVHRQPIGTHRRTTCGNSNPAKHAGCCTHNHSSAATPTPVGCQQLPAAFVQQAQRIVQAGRQHAQPVTRRHYTGDRVMQVVCVQPAHADVEAPHGAVHAGTPYVGALSSHACDIILRAAAGGAQRGGLTSSTAATGQRPHNEKVKHTWNSTRALPPPMQTCSAQREHQHHVLCDDVQHQQCSRAPP